VARALTNSSSPRLTWLRTKWPWDRCAALSRRNQVSAMAVTQSLRCSTLNCMLLMQAPCSCTSSTTLRGLGLATRSPTTGSPLIEIYHHALRY
jgi:hypothetical protein